MIAQVSVTYGSAGKIKALSPEDFQELRHIFPSLTDDQHRAYFYGTDGLIDLTTSGEWLAERDITFEIKRFAGCYKVEKQGPSKTVNLQVSIPNLLLFSVTEVKVEEDYCTDSLQEDLDAGWRILAVCPPANQRRPGYVLGRTKEAAR